MHTLIRGLLLVGLTALPVGVGCQPGQPVAEIRPGSASAPAEESGEAVAADVKESDWPWWRGPRFDGIAPGEAPTEWSPTKNVLWQVDVPGRGHASPIVWGEQVFIAAADETKQTMSLLSYGRDDGKPRWTCLLHEGGFMHVHSKNSQASPTPACDGKHVYWIAMVDDAIWLSAVTLAGQIAWQTEVGPFVSMHGYGSSPVLYKGLVIVQGDSNGPGWLAAVNGQTGKIHWRVQRGTGASFATPLVAQVAGKTQLLLHGQDKVVSYNPESGEQLWEAEGPATVCANTMCTSGDLVFASGGYPQRNVLAIKADGSGQIVWRKSWKCYVPSMLVDEGRLVIPQDDGVLHCVEAASGKELWTKRVGGDLTSSPVVAGGRLYVTTEAGTTAVFDSSQTANKVAENENGDRCYTTPTFCDGRVFLRTHTKLMCIGGR